MMKFSEIPKYTSEGNYSVTMRLKFLIQWIEERIKEDGLELNPDFQRGHIWNEEQQIRYIEHLIKGGKTARDIYFNQAGWMDSFTGEFVCVDGLQRLTAIQKFIGNEIKVFGCYLDEFEDKDIMLRSLEVVVHVNNLKTRKEVLQWYIEFNSAGTVHTDEEIERVRELLKKEVE